MSNKSTRFICPDCKRKLVLFAIGRTYQDGGSPVNEDCYYCSWKGCDFFAYSHDRAPIRDKNQMERLLSSNQGVGK